MADTTDLVDAALTRSEINRALHDLYVRPTALAKLAGINPGVLTRIRLGRQARIARATQGRVLEAIIQLEKGEVVLESRSLHQRPRPSGHPATWTHCANGHRFTDITTYVDCRGKRRCRICLAAIARRRWDRRKSA